MLGGSWVLPVSHTALASPVLLQEAAESYLCHRSMRESSSSSGGSWVIPVPPAAGGSPVLLQEAAWSYLCHLQQEGAQFFLRRQLGPTSSTYSRSESSSSSRCSCVLPVPLAAEGNPVLLQEVAGSYLVWLLCSAPP